MKIDLIGMIFNKAGSKAFDGVLLDDDGKEMEAAHALDALIMEYAKVKNGGTSDVVVVRPLL